jgi:dienelactone hydrolase
MRTLIALALLFFAAPASAQDPLTLEMKRRNDELVAQGFNLTWGVSVTPTPTRIELLVPPTEDFEHTVTLWFETAKGEIAVRLTGPGGETLAAWTGRSGEQRLVRALAPGKYVLEVGGAAGRGEVGVKGPVIGRCNVDASRFTEHAADPAKGFHWPYLLLAPKAATSTTLMVVPNNTGFLTEDLELLRASGMCELAREAAVADRLGVAVLVPLFPRTADVYVHALSRDALTTKAPAIARVDLQLIAMIDDARAVLGKSVRARVLMSGFSASGSFTSRFAVLHPDRVLAAAVGSPGGWPIAPAADWTYPVGIADVASLTGSKVDLAAARKVSFFFFMGDADTNDSVPYRDSFTAADEALVMQKFGKTPVSRWEAAKRLYAAAKLRATFKLYPDVPHEVTPEMVADIEAAFAAAMR